MSKFNDKFLMYISLSSSILAMVFSIYNYVLIRELQLEKSILHSLKPIDLPKIEYYNAVYGNSSDIIIYEYMEYLCPFCAVFYFEVFPEIKKKYIDSGKISYVYKNLIVHGDLAKKLSLYAACIYKEKGLEEYINYKSEILREVYNNVLYLKNSTNLEISINETLNKYRDVEDCIKNNEIEKLIDAETYEAVKIYGMMGTPSFIIAININKISEERIKEMKNILDQLKPYGFSYNMWISSDRKYFILGFSGVLPIEFFDQVLSLS
ncbi:MAG: DsbA family protein [Nanopusillaceae archaeon]